MRVHFSGWTFDSEAHELRRGEELAHLSKKAFRLLDVLIERRPAAVSKEALLELVWPNSEADEALLPGLMKEIRATLGDDAKNPKIIRTVFGHGYAFAAQTTEEKPPMATLESIAVVPFLNLSDPKWDHVSNGIAEELINVLASSRSIDVRPASTSFRYQSERPDLKSAAAEMRVQAIVTVRTEVRDDVVKIQAALVNAKSDSQLWGGRFQGPITELQDLQRQLQGEIIDRVVKHLPVAERREPIVHNPQAYQHFLHGVHLFNRRDAEGFKRAIQEFADATRLDPRFARAHAALAEAYVTLGSRDLRPAHETFPAAKRAALTALECDPLLSGAHSALGAVQELYEWDWDAAEKSHSRAVNYDPSYANAAQWFGLHYARRGNHPEAKYWIGEALAREPHLPILNTNAAFISYLGGEYATAVRQSDLALDLAPHYEAARIMSGVACIQIDPERAVSQLEEAARLSTRQPYVLSHLASAYGAVGRLEDARRIADEMEKAAQERYVSPVDRAMAALACGDRTAALDNLEEGLDKHSAWLVYLPHEPRLHVLRDERRFKAILAAVGTQEWARA
jgi:DNA-binding winged helix-turn-helix (wHTH) protein/Tfp pilus assembly protein PilF